ncbi:MAG: hypothetical protein IJ837_00935 [Clostridia bacterium]|nr:hypothetical protein [Clostridia bacterium]
MKQLQKDFDKTTEKEKAILFLKGKGVLIDFNQNLHLFHGRVSSGDKNFFVDPNFDNSGQTLGHYNSNGISGLHASAFDIAEKYAEKRFSEYEDFKDKKIEVHQIVPKEDNLLILNLQKLFDIEELEPYLKSYNISNEEIEEIKKNVLPLQDKQKVQKAIKTIAFSSGVTNIMPKLFSSKDSVVILRDLKNICEKNKENGLPYVLDADLEKYAQKKAEDDEKLEEQIYDIAGALNVYKMLTEEGDIKTLMSKFQSDFNFTENSTLNLDFFREFLRNENIIGVKQKLWRSDVIGKTNFDDYFFFDTQRINSKTAQKKIERSNQKEGRPLET